MNTGHYITIPATSRKWRSEFGSRGSIDCPTTNDCGKYCAPGIAGLRTFAGMIKGSKVLKLFNFVSEFRDPFLAPELYGQTLAFVGDMTMTTNPIVTGLPSPKL